MISKLKSKFGNNAHFKEIVRGSALAFSAKILGAGLGLISSLIIARYYGADIVGLVAIINSVMGIFCVIGLMGTNVAILRLIPEYIENYSLSTAFSVYKKVLTIVIILSMFSGALLYFSSPFISISIFHKEHLVFFLALAALFIIFRTIGRLNTDMLRGLQKVKLFAKMQLLPSVITLFLLIIMTLFFYDKYNPVYIVYTSNMLMAIILIGVVSYLFKRQKKVDADAESPISTKEVISLSFPMFLTASMNMVISQTDTIMLGMMRSDIEVGIYAIALKLALLTSFILTAVNAIAAPKFSQLYHSGRMQDLKEVAQKSSQLIFWSSLPLILIYIFFGYYILLVFGEDFTSGYYALMFLAAGQFVNASAGSVAFFLNMTGHQLFLRNIIVSSVFINIVLNYLLIPKLGVNGAAIATSSTIIYINIIAAIGIKRKFNYYISYFPINYLMPSRFK